MTIYQDFSKIFERPWKDPLMKDLLKTFATLQNLWVKCLKILEDPGKKEQDSDKTAENPGRS